MQLIRFIVLLALITSSASAQATTRPTQVEAGTVRTAGADLVIDNLDLVLAPGLGSGATAEKNGVRVSRLMIVARVTNRGTERWAAPQGAVGFSLRAGREEDAGERRRTAGGVSEIPGQTSGLGRAIMAPFGPFRAEAPVPGSLAPGESRVITVVARNRNGDTFLIFERDKYYTLEASLRTRGDVNEGNNRSLRVGRFDASRDRLVTRWEPLAIRSAPTGGTVEVNAPPRR